MCGNCSVCSEKQQAKFQFSPNSSPNSADIKSHLSDLIAKIPNASNILKTKFLCGITTPNFTKLRLKKSESFGKYENLRFSDVLKVLEA
jgi:ATP-dependent DNA helicase RecQ